MEARKTGSILTPEARAPPLAACTGETNFPLAGRGLGPRGGKYTVGDCSVGLSVQPVAGEAILFYNFDPAQPHALGAIDQSSAHAGCPVRSGTKWVANVWLHNKDQGADTAQHLARVKKGGK